MTFKDCVALHVQTQKTKTKEISHVEKADTNRGYALNLN